MSPRRIFDSYLFVDWSARSQLGPARECADAVWVGERTADAVRTQYYFRTRDACIAALLERLSACVSQGQRVLVGFDFPFGFPVGFAAALELPGEAWQATWNLLQDLI